jgi:SNF2 family DNA or RNA helicase
MVPYAHQLKALELGADSTRYGYLMDMGTGKSKVTIDNVVHLYLAGKVNRVMIFAPKGAFNNWPDIELPKHLPEGLQYSLHVWGREPRKPHPDLQIYVMNIEAIAYSSGYASALRFVKSGRTMIIVDESTCIKNYKAIRTKKLMELARYSRYRRILSGDPMPQSPLDLYSQCSFLGYDCLGFTSYFAFRARYCEMKMTKLNNGHEFKTVIGFKNEDELREKLKTFTYRVTKDECLDLPPKVYQIREVELTKEQIKHYNQLCEDSVAWINAQSVVTAPMVLTRLVRLHQLVCGHLTDDTGKVIPIKNNRVDQLMEVLDETRGKTVIWATYVPDIRGLVETIGREFGDGSVVDYFGDTSDNDRRDAVHRFQNDDTCRFFVGNPSTGRFSLTLTASANSVYYSNSYNLEHRSQSEDRIHRIGQQAARVTYVDLVSRRTIDERILRALKEKRNLADKIVGGSVAWQNFFVGY